MMDKEKETNLVPAVEKAVRIIEYLESENRPLTLTEICTGLGLPKSTTSNILSTLKHFRYIEQRDNRGPFELGIRFLSLANNVRSHFSLTKAAAQNMEILTQETGETSKLSVLHYYESVTIHKVQSPREMSINTEVGRRFPLHAGAASKLLLAYASHDTKMTVLQQPLTRYTPNTIIDPNILAKELETIARQGYAMDKEEYIEGIVAIARPVFGGNGQVIASLSIPFLATGNNGSKVAQLLACLLLTANDISQAMGHSGSKLTKR